MFSKIGIGCKKLVKKQGPKIGKIGKKQDRKIVTTENSKNTRENRKKIGKPQEKYCNLTKQH